MMIVGVDPGRKGCAVALDTDTREALLMGLPFDEDGMLALEFPRWLLRVCKGSPAMVVMEKLNAARGDKISGHALFRMGIAFGQVEALIRATMLPSRMVTPQQWQKVIHEGIDGKMPAKEKSMLTYKRMFPDDPIPKRPRQTKVDDNAVDALLIAQYGALKYGGGQIIRPRFITQ